MTKRNRICEPTVLSVPCNSIDDCIITTDSSCYKLNLINKWLANQTVNMQREREREMCGGGICMWISFYLQSKKHTKTVLCYYMKIYIYYCSFNWSCCYRLCPILSVEHQQIVRLDNRKLIQCSTLFYPCKHCQNEKDRNETRHLHINLIPQTHLWKQSNFVCPNVSELTEPDLFLTSS